MAPGTAKLSLSMLSCESTYAISQVIIQLRIISKIPVTSAVWRHSVHVLVGGKEGGEGEGEGEEEGEGEAEGASETEK
jgi:hypothetical protein